MLRQSNTAGAVRACVREPPAEAGPESGPGRLNRLLPYHAMHTIPYATPSSLWYESKCTADTLLGGVEVPVWVDVKLIRAFAVKLHAAGCLWVKGGAQRRGVVKQRHMRGHGHTAPCGTVPFALFNNVHIHTHTHTRTRTRTRTHTHAHAHTHTHTHNHDMHACTVLDDVPTDLRR